MKAHFDLHGKTVGVIGMGHIGKAFASIMRGFGCKIIAYDIRPDRRIPVTEVRYVALDELFRTSDIVSLHCPLNQNTEYLINEKSLAALQPTAVLVNSARGRLVDTKAVLDALDQNRLAGYAGDRLRQHPKVLLTAH